MDTELKVKDTDNFPDFIIGGAMKSGTGTLHHILNSHPKIFIPDKEIYFFNIDDIHHRSDFFARSSDKGLKRLKDKANFAKYRCWYKSFFESASKDQLIGEDSTLYLASSFAPERIRKLLPDVKLIFMLRNPVSRAYSHYWHLVRTGRAIYSFEKTLQYMPGTILRYGFYKDQIKRYLQLFPNERLKFVIFENFIEEMQENINEIVKFIELKSTIDISEIDIHKNPGRYPRSLSLQLGFNRFFREYAGRCYESHLPDTEISAPPELYESIKRIFTKLNYSGTNTKPPLKEDTEEFLKYLYTKKNKGLMDLIGEDLDVNCLEIWNLKE